MVKTHHSNRCIYTQLPNAAFQGVFTSFSTEIHRFEVDQFLRVPIFITLGVSEAPLRSRSLQQLYYLSIEKSKSFVTFLYAVFFSLDVNL